MELLEVVVICCAYACRWNGLFYCTNYPNPFVLVICSPGDQAILTKPHAATDPIHLSGIGGVALREAISTAIHHKKMNF
jgi:hypothetical protein